MPNRTLQARLDARVTVTPEAEPVCRLVRSLATTALNVRDAITLGALGTAFAGTRGEGAGGDIQKDLDVFVDEAFLKAARDAGAAYFGSEELEHPVSLDSRGTLALAIDPLDGSSNIDTNVSVGTIFSILPAVRSGNALDSFLQPGTAQLAAGFFVYGPQLSLVLSLGQGTSIFVYSAAAGDFVEAYPTLAIPTRTGEFAINMSNYRHWDDAVRCYVDECLKGNEGAHARDYNMRWIASMVADAYRIFRRGGIYLYPADGRKGYGHGRLRLVYEAAPIAMLIEQAGGAATDGQRRILDLTPCALHERTPLVFGSTSEVEMLALYYQEPHEIGMRSPLFGNRGLFRS